MDQKWRAKLNRFAPQKREKEAAPAAEEWNREENYSSSTALDRDKNEKSVKKKGTKHPLAAYYLFFCACLLAGGYLISPAGKLDELHVEGTSLIPEQLVIESSSISTDQTVIGILTDQKNIREQIQASLPQIKQVSFDWSGINDITLKVAEYATIAYLETKDGYDAVLETGEILDENLSVPRGNSPLLTNFEDDSNLAMLLKGLNSLSSDVLNSISEIAYTGKEENPLTVTFYMNDGNEVKGLLSTFAEKMMYYPSIVTEIGQQKGVVDMEVGTFFTSFEQLEQEEQAGTAAEDSEAAEEDSTTEDGSGQQTESVEEE